MRAPLALEKSENMFLRICSYLLAFIIYWISSITDSHVIMRFYIAMALIRSKCCVNPASDHRRWDSGSLSIELMNLTLVQWIIKMQPFCSAYAACLGFFMFAWLRAFLRVHVQLKRISVNAQVSTRHASSLAELKAFWRSQLKSRPWYFL